MQESEGRAILTPNAFLSKNSWDYKSHLIKVLTDFAVRGEKMRCVICGTAIKPWFEVCYGCYNPISEDNGRIPEPMMANRFMKEIKIDGW